jgi:prepilin-type processing-associated H-X9-DG protein
VDDGCCGIYPLSSGTHWWWNLPGSRYHKGCNFSFADGHAEFWKLHETAVLTCTGPNQAADYFNDLPRVEAGTIP